jgi:glycosyltransferase involved in cell wall biosynthesis
MLNEGKDITVVIIVLNNVDQISECLNSVIKQGVNKVIVIDGGSNDGTADVVKKFPCELHVIGKTGLSHSRQFGIDLVETEYLALVDSDNVLEDNCLVTLRDELKSSNFIGLSAIKLSYNKKNIFCMYQEWMNSKKVNKPGKKLVIGTPAIYRTIILKEKVRYNTDIKVSDDTDLCYRLLQKGYLVGTGSGICYEKMVDNLSEFIGKAVLYGRSDLEFFRNNKNRRYSIGTHAFRNYFLKMFYYSLVDFKFKFIPLVILYSFSRFWGLYFNLFRKPFGWTNKYNK